MKEQRPGDQPPPIVREGAPDVQTLVLADLEARRQVGIDRYGTALQTHNGRDMLRDAYEEAMDLTVYLRGTIAERDDRRGRPHRIPFVYLAGPITSDPMGNTRRAVAIATKLLRWGFAPFVPHLSVYWEMSAGPIDYEAWLAYDFAVLARCDALIRMHGDSPGADREVAEAGRLGLPVFELDEYDEVSEAVQAWGHLWRTS